MYPAGSRVLTNEGEIGVVIRQNKEFPNRPVLRMEKYKDGKDYPEGVIKNLILENHIFIEGVLS